MLGVTIFGIFCSVFFSVIQGLTETRKIPVVALRWAGSTLLSGGAGMRSAISLRSSTSFGSHGVCRSAAWWNAWPALVVLGGFID